MHEAWKTLQLGQWFSDHNVR